MRGRKTDRGIALLEMLIALMIMSMLAVMTAAAFGTFGRVLAGVGRTDQAVEAALSQRQIQSWAQDRPAGLNQGAALVFAGQNTRLTFQTIDYSGRYWKGALISVEVVLEDTQLFARITGKHTERAQPDTTILILDRGPVISLKISYFGKHALDAPPHWDVTWDDAVRIPQLVKVEWQGANGAVVPLVFEPGLRARQTFRSLSSLSPPR